MQIIFIVECSKESKSDWVYISSLLKSKYNITGHKLSPIYLNGKGRYFSVDKNINSLIKQYDDITKVIFCVDLDSTHINISDVELNNKIKDYANSNNYYFAWFNRDIEEVFLGERISKNLKSSKAIHFLRSNKINDLDLNKCSKKDPISFGTSNIVLVLDEILERK